MQTETAQRSSISMTSAHADQVLQTNHFLKKLDGTIIQCVYLNQHRVNATDLRVHVLLEIFVEVFEDEVEFALGVNHLVEPAQKHTRTKRVSACFDSEYQSLHQQIDGLSVYKEQCEPPVNRCSRHCSWEMMLLMMLSSGIRYARLE